MVGNSFSEIRFGDDDARTELIYSPDLLIDGFIDKHNIIHDITVGRRFLVYGLKGSGKTAIGSKIELMANENTMVEQYTLERFDYPRFEGMSYNLKSSQLNTDSKSHKRNDIDSNRTWELILNVALLGMFSKDSKLESKSGNRKINNIVSELEAVGALPNKDFSVIVNKLSKTNFIINFGLVKYARETNSTTSEIYSSLYDNVNEAIKDVVLSKQYYLIIDGLDSIVSRKDVQIRVLSGLLHATREVNLMLAQNKLSAKIIMLCRKDLLDLLEDPNKTKIVDDFGIELNWYQEGTNRDEIDLIYMLNKRASLSLGRKVSIFDEFFGPNIENKASYKFILDYTRHIPRDLIRLINEIQKVHKMPKDTSRIRVALDNYSAAYFYNEVRDEMDGIIKDGEFENITLLFSSLHKYRTSQREIENKAQELGIKLTSDDIWRILSRMFDAGVIGNVARVDGADRYTFKYRNRHSKYISSDEIVVHLALQRALNIRGGFHNKCTEYD